MNYTWTKDSCDHFLTTNGHSDFQRQGLFGMSVTTAPADTCTVTTLALSITLCVCGIVTNLVNIQAFMCNSDVLDDKTPFLMTIVISDLLFLATSLPYFIFQTGYIHLDQSQYTPIGIYIGIRYALSFILIFVSSWMLIALVTKKILSRQFEGDDTSIQPLRESIMAADHREQKKSRLQSSSVCILAVPIVATSIHGVKLFEYQRAGDSPNAPWLMRKRLTGLEYELYTVTVNVAVTTLAPYMFLLCSTVYYLVKVVTVRMRSKGEREPIKDFCLLCLLGLLHLLCYGGSLFQQMTMLFTKVIPVDNSCSDNINTTVIILNASVKILLFKLFTYHFRRYKLPPLKNVSQFLTRQSRGDVVRGLKFSFSNPSYDQEGH